MRNFYYVVSFNLTNPIVKTMLDKQGVTELTGFVLDMKLRSKLFISKTETTTAALIDFHKKLPLIYTDADKTEHYVSQFSIVNPKLTSEADVSDMLAKFGGKYLNNWDENCCGVMFFADNPNYEAEINLDPNSWMVKYEILYSDDAIELAGNGDFIFAQMDVPRTTFNSTYH